MPIFEVRFTQVLLYREKLTESKLQINKSLFPFVCCAQFLSNEPWYFLFLGIGFASAVIVFLVNCDYNVLLTWSFYYLFSSFTSVLPWSKCDNDWNTADCSTGHRRAGTVTVLNQTLTSSYNESYRNVTLGTIVENGTVTAAKSFVSDPVTEFWE